METCVVDVSVTCPSLLCSGTPILLLAKVTAKQQTLPEPAGFVFRLPLM